MDRIWYVDDDETTSRLSLKQLDRAFPDTEIRYFATCEAALEAAEEQRPDVVILDELFGDSPMQGKDFLSVLRSRHPGTRILFATVISSVPLAVSVMRMGASDFLLKPFDPRELIDAVHRALAARKIDRRNETIEEGPRRTEASFDGLIGTTPVMRDLIRRAEVVARTHANVLITGETGTGKGLLARYIHEVSDRAHMPFMDANLAATSEDLMESLLFGHEPGAFTGARDRRQGKFELAAGGTLFLDEVGDLGASAQLKLLRVLQDGTFERMGGKEAQQADVRVIAATNQDLEERIEAKAFREDLYYRLHVCQLVTPPLRRRMEDLDALVQYLLVRFNREYGRVVRSVHPEVTRRWRAHRWPGNLRELAARVAEAVILTTGEEVRPDEIRNETPKREDRVELRLHNLLHDLPLGEAVCRVHRALVFPSLDARRKRSGDWNISRTADDLRVSTTWLQDFLVEDLLRGDTGAEDAPPADTDRLASAAAERYGIGLSQAASLIRHGASRGKL